MDELKELFGFIGQECGLSLEGKNVHIAIFAEPYLTRLFKREKTIESRFSKKKGSPYGKVEKGDYVIVKKTGGPFVGLFEVAWAEYDEIAGREDLLAIKEKFGEGICADEAYWQIKSGSRYASLMGVSNLIKFSKPYVWHKKNRQAWIVCNVEQLGYKMQKSQRT